MKNEKNRRETPLRRKKAQKYRRGTLLPAVWICLFTKKP